MTPVLSWLGLDAARWKRLGPDSLWSATAIVVVASGFLTLNRFGGLATSAPRAFLRMTLVGVWGWLGLALMIWFIAGSVAPARPSIARTLGVVGWAHVPMLALAGVIFVTAVLMQLLGPGFVMAVFVFAVWLPASLVTGASSTCRIGLVRAAAIVTLPYAIWLMIPGRHLLSQVEHLL